MRSGSCVQGGSRVLVRGRPCERKGLGLCLPPLSLLCADDKLATPRNDENLLQRALQKMLSGMKERKKILLHEIHIRAGATNNSGR